MQIFTNVYPFALGRYSLELERNSFLVKFIHEGFQVKQGTLLFFAQKAEWAFCFS